MTANIGELDGVKAKYSINKYKSSSNIKITDKINNPLVESELLTFPNQPIIWSIVNGSNKGQIYEFLEGRGVIIIGNFEKPLIFIADELDRAAFEVALSLCPDNAFIYWQPLYHRWFLKKG